MFELEEKGYLSLLIVIPVVALLFLYVQFWKNKKQKEFGDVELIQKLSPQKSVFKPILKMVLFLLGVTSIIIGIVNPMMGTKMEKVKRQGIDIVFAVDISKSMLAEDVAPSRLEKSKQLVSQMINQLGSDRIGIIAYSGNAFPILPMTSDYSVAKMFLQSMNPGMISSQGTSIDQAINLAATFFDKKDKTNKLLILISDGEDHSDSATEAAEEAKKVGLKIVTIGVGTEKGGPIPLKRNGIVESFQRDKENEVVITKRNAEVLTKIAKSCNGGYVDGNSTKAVLNYVKNVLDNTQKTEFESTQMANFQSQFQWFIGFGFLLLFIDFFVLETTTKWVRKMNLFNEKES
ncbi:VWA domain-containing protein [Flavobacterium sp. SUN046]|uniref:VWA domain-containing protein n=1 Tax=Flavobacterium sp. SUN046 TaxID=3002440 RepID=UPI002DB6125B|nr:VWA domain-containing protein [Flavobacterium sp. SUN046]MEC4050145.1 VWA domain-containing protein [Flavobacterium sp. SUN046]